MLRKNLSLSKMIRSFLVVGRLRSLLLIVKRRVLSWIVAGQSHRKAKRFVVLPGDLVSNEIIVAGLYEENLLATLFEGILVKQLGDFSKSTAIDVGANIGNHSLYLSRYFRKVIAFEPNPTALSVLKCNVELSEGSNVEVVPVGLSDQSGSFPFSQDDSGNLGGSGFLYAGVSHPSREKLCRVEVGDDYIGPERLEGPIGLIKLDTEGSEFRALKGMTNILGLYKPIVIFESNRSGGATGGNAIISLLRDAGYSSFAAVEQSAQRGSRIRRLFDLILKGDLVSVYQVEELSEARYPMIIATPQPIE